MRTRWTALRLRIGDQVERRRGKGNSGDADFYIVEDIRVPIESARSGSVDLREQYDNDPKRATHIIVAESEYMHKVYRRRRKEHDDDH